jgi:DNA-binding CsgD family transcriptional regulator
MAEQGRAVSEEALELGRRLDDAQTIAYTTVPLATEARLARDIEQVLPYLDEGIAASDVPELADCHLVLLINKMQWQIERGMPEEDIEETIRTVRRDAEKAGSVRLGIVVLFTADYRYLRGRWDDALAELEAFLDLPDAYNLAIVHAGLSALIALHRDQLSTAREHLAPYPEDLADLDHHVRINALQLVRARALLAEREGRREDAVSMLEETITDEYESMVLERHGWLAFLVRTALAADRQELAEAAEQAMAKDAAKDPRPDYLATAQQCTGLLTGDPAPLRQALAYHRNTHRTPDAASCAEDLAAVLAATGDTAAARAAMHEAAHAYQTIGAAGELARADARWRTHGLRRGVQCTCKRPATGLASLTPTEHRIAQLVAEGLSNPGIAERLYSSRRTVQTHVSRILAKLDMHSRTEIVRMLAPTLHRTPRRPTVPVYAPHHRKVGRHVVPTTRVAKEAA